MRESIKREKDENDSRNSEAQVSADMEESDDQPAVREEGDDRDKVVRKEKASTGDFVIEIKKGNLKEERVCRICHFGSEAELGESEIVELGCDCRGELGSSHRHCAETWFGLKGDRTCEICRKTARNIRSNNVEEDTSIFMMEWSQMRLVAATLDGNDSSERSRRFRRSCCNLLLGCLVLAFVLPWFFRGFSIF